MAGFTTFGSPQIRTCRFTASGSSEHGFATGGIPSGPLELAAVRVPGTHVPELR